MTQITFAISTMQIGVAGGVGTTGNSHLLPEWAPPIEYIGPLDTTNQDYLAILNFVSTVANHCYHSETVRVLDFGYRTEAPGVGRQYVTILKAIIAGATANSNIMTLSYRAVGEVVRP